MPRSGYQSFEHRVFTSVLRKNINARVTAVLLVVILKNPPHPTGEAKDLAGRRDAIN